MRVGRAAHQTQSFSEFPLGVNIRHIRMNAPSSLFPPTAVQAPPSIKEERREAIRRRQNQITYAERSNYALPRDLKKVFDEAKGGSK